MANPRKFSEKIAQHKQKQAEETAEFERIMREVSDVTSKPEDVCAQYGGPGGGSAGPGARAAGGSSPGRAPLQRGRAASSVGPMRARPADRKHDTSPYGSSVYLSPPADTSWRRTNSDSALHQSCGGDAGHQQPAVSLSPNHYPVHHHSHRSNTDSTSLMSMLGASQIRPRSSCDMPRVPGINVYESGGTCGVGGGGGGGGATLGGGDAQVPGGSLPDLTSVHYPEAYPASPHRTPPEYHRRTFYKQGPTSPGALSPGGGGGLSPGGGAGGVASMIDQHQLAYDTQNHLSVPNSNSYLHHNNHQSMSPLEQSWITGYQAHCSPPSLHSSHSNINIVSNMAHSPGSPAAESPQPDSYYISQTLLQPFQQISMMDTPVTNYNYMNHSSSPSSQSNSSHHTYSQAGSDAERCGRPRDSRTERDPVAGGNAPLFPPVTSPSAPSIPDIIFTDFSGDLGMSKDLETGLFGCEDDRLREGLDPVDLDGLTLLADSGSLLPDPSAEDVFRMDRM